MEDLIKKLQQCQAVSNKSFDPGNTTSEDFQQPWNDAIDSLLKFGKGSDHSDSNSSGETQQSTQNDWIQRLWALHTEPTRHYHTAIHLQEMMEYLQVIRDCHVVDQQQLHYVCLVLAIYFHDAIYDPKSSTNEEDSEKLWQSCAKDLHLPNDIVTRVSHLILETKHHKLPSSYDADPTLSLFLDLDLAVLAKEPDAYMAYASMIRREYHFVPAETYCTKRAEILQSMLTSRLFGSPFFASCEERARRNLQQEIESLKQGTIPSV